MTFELFNSPDLNDRSIAMALSMIMTVIVIMLIGAYMALDSYNSISKSKRPE
jgi:hypothetical protein